MHLLADIIAISWRASGSSLARDAVVWVDGTLGACLVLLKNLALARLHCGVELDSAYNIQLHVQDAPITQRGARLEATWHGRQARVLHFSGGGRRKYPAWRGLYARATSSDVQRAIAEIFIRSGDRSFSTPEFVAFLRRYRLSEAANDLVDVLIAQLQVQMEDAK